MLQKISQCWSDFCIVAAPGPSLNEDLAGLCRGYPVIAVNDAHRLFPFADVLYANGPAWWDHYDGVRSFNGERWSSHGNKERDDKIATAEKYGLNLVKGCEAEGFSYDPAFIHYGDNGGFQAVNVAIHKLGARGIIALVGFDMRMVAGKRHFFGDHPAGLTNTTRGYTVWPKRFAQAAKTLPPEIRIMNCTPGSALDCFPFCDLRDVLPKAVAA